MPADAWFSRAAALMPIVDLDVGDLTVEYQCHHGSDVFTHHHIFEQGQLVAWEVGGLAESNLVLRQPLSSHLAMLGRAGLGNRLLETTEVVDRASDRLVPPPPLDEIRCIWGRDLPVIRTSGKFVVNKIYTDSPFGTVDVFLTFDRGQVIKAGLGSPPNPDIVMTRTYRAALAHRDGTIEALESLEGGDLSGDFSTLALFLGIAESDEYVADLQAFDAPWSRHLVALGEVLSGAGWAPVARSVAQDTVSMRSAP